MQDENPRPDAAARDKPAAASGALYEERNQRREKRKRRNMLIICALCVALLTIIFLYYTTDFLEWAKIRNYPMKYKETIDAMSDEYMLDPALVCAVIYTESGFDSGAVSVDGARGLMQIMPDTGAWIASKLGDVTYGADRLFEPELNIRYGCWFLNYLFTRFAGDGHKALAAYNAGQGSVDKWLKRPECSSDGVTLMHIPSRETRHYVKKVRAAHDIYLEIYYADETAA